MAAPVPTRSCIEGGGDLMVTFHAPGPVTRGTATSTSKPCGPGARHWDRAAQGKPPGETIIWMDSRGGSLGEVLEFLPKPGAPDLFAERLGFLRSCGRIYMATKAEPETGESWLSFALDRRVSPRQALTNLGCIGGWPAAQGMLSRVFGRTVTERTRPWSIALPLSGEALESRTFRLGTAAWGRLPEDAGKRAHMAAALDETGGDGSGAADDYAAIAALHTGPLNFANAIGSAAEVDVSPNGAQGLLLTLRTQTPNFNAPNSQSKPDNRGDT
ncbi:hypothetical protein GRI41_08440 [Altererythrobacter aquaemixtae]|uniref:Uncharacterized protein n=1 Tax=Pontixanthobacter aquaemixtae TaxID=1958940 RepID=A0A844ZV70_9SPHN|nr:hypothetical protein [Pontixanthobacter aquaemixtae]